MKETTVTPLVASLSVPEPCQLPDQYCTCRLSCVRKGGRGLGCRYGPWGVLKLSQKDNHKIAVVIDWKVKKTTTKL